ncbi:hypothetical protein Salat_2551400 [Sesamum alatum]|uniref:Uncharacterized protein n=1 Tax=Sesamum alatum TaxID=300844 RepID=A0AAE2CCM2_9LAMI|nr:hypothetical protein Salat_2551400 [Sesamum alatum]
MINGYIYNRGPLLHMLREFIAGRDMVRPAKTRFATAFLILKRFHVEKVNLKKMFTSEMWTKSKYAKDAQGKLVASIILMPSFWKRVAYALKVAGPLVKMPNAFRPRSSKNITSKASSSKGSSLKAFNETKKASTSSSKSTKIPLRLVDEEEEEVNFDDTDEEDLNCYISNSEREDKNDDNNEDVEL